MSRPISAASRRGSPTRSAICDELVVKPVGEVGRLRHHDRAARQPRPSSRTAAAELLADPANYISQPMIELSVAPTLCDDGRRAAPCRSAAVRGHRARHLGAAGRADAGGAAAGLAGRQLLAGRRLEGHLGAGVSERRPEPCSPATPSSLFWLARYVERAENLARILDVNETFAARRRGGRNWLSMLRINADEEAFFEQHAAPDAASVLRFYLLDADNPTSICRDPPCARERAHPAAADLDRDVGAAQRVPQPRSAR